MNELILFLLTFFFTFFLYIVFIILPIKRKKKKKIKYKDPVEVTYLVKKYNLNIKKVNYNQLLWLVAVVSSVDISLIITLIMLLNNFILEIFLGFIFTMVIIVVSYHCVYLLYKKKGMIIDG